MARDQQQEQLEQQSAAVIRMLYWGLLLLSLFWGVKLLLPVLLPFILAYGLALALERPIGALSAGMRLPRGLAALLCVLLAAVFTGGVLLLLGAGIAAGLRSLSGAAAHFLSEGLLPAASCCFEHLEHLAARIAPSAGTAVESGTEDLMGLLTDGAIHLSGGLLTALGTGLAALPSLLMKVFITLIAAVFMAGDFPRIRRFLEHLLPEGAGPFLQEAECFFGRTAPRCAGAYFLLFCLTFSELAAGFWLLHIPRTLASALLIALLDILPILGTGTVLLPWAVWAFWQGQGGLGAGLLLLYGGITLIRQFLEPRLLGKQIQIHPVLTFLGMLVGLRFFGFLGIFLLPLGLAFLRRLHERGLIHLRALEGEEKPT